MPMTPAKMCKFTAIVLDTELDSALRLFASTGIAHFVDFQLRTRELGTELQPVEASDRFYHLSNLVSRTTTLIKEMKVLRGGGIKEPLHVPDIPDDDYLTNLDKELKIIETKFTDISRSLEDAEESGDKAGKKAAKKGIQELAKEKRALLLGWEELLERERNIEETKTLFGKTKRTYVMVGWVPSKENKAFTEIIRKQSGDTIALEVIEFQEPLHHGHAAVDLDAEIETRDRPPTKLTNPKRLKSFETLTNAFGVPSHREIDPTWFMAIGFPIIFGLMFGDIGHGLLLLFFSILGMIGNKRGVDLGELGNYFLKGSGLLAVCAISATFFGVLYGEFLGLSITGMDWYIALYESPFGQIMRGFLLNLFQIFDFDAGVQYFLHPPHGPHHPAIWFSAFESPDETWLLFVLSIIIGVIHLSIAIFIDLLNKLRHKEYKHAIIGPLIWLWFFLGFAIIIFNKGINFQDWFIWNDPIQPNLFGSGIADVGIFLIAPLLVMILGGIFTLGLMEGFMEAIEHLIASISNTISYARILALNMAHAGFAKTFLFLGGVTTTSVTWLLNALFEPTFEAYGTVSLLTVIIMLLIGTIFVLIMEGLLSFIHTLRLHWVEAYLKFYAGTGYEYKPLTIPYQWTTMQA